MKYDICPKCYLNYKLCEQKLCSVCSSDQMADDFENYQDDFDIICPICYKNKIGVEDIMCTKCAQKRKKSCYE